MKKEKKMIFPEGTDTYDICRAIRKQLDKILNKDFETVNAELKKETMITFVIDDGFLGDKE